MDEDSVVLLLVLGDDVRIQTWVGNEGLQSFGTSYPRKMIYVRNFRLCL